MFKAKITLKMLKWQLYALLYEEQACWWTGSPDTLIGCPVGKRWSAQRNSGTS
jgi:hypothetical protein